MQQHLPPDADRRPAVTLPVYVWAQLDEARREELLTRPAQTEAAAVTAAVTEIVEQVRRGGDPALMELSARFDRRDAAEPLLISKARLAGAGARLSPALRQAIDTAYHNLRTFHQAQSPQHLRLEVTPGVICQSLTHPLDAVGLYVPGGSAALLSTALMLAVPAQLAGCPQIVLCSPPPVSDAILYCAELCGVSCVAAVGGAHAIAALAYGTASIPRVCKIFGPGNQYVTTAKRLVSADAAGAAIDMPAGPSEVMVIADGRARPDWVAADLLSQAEHGPDSQVLLLSDDPQLPGAVAAALAKQLLNLPRRDIASRALSHSCALITASLAQACELACRYAPEHLILQVQEPHALLPELRNAGSIFVGACTPEALGDYASGTNHTLPTYGYARAYSALGTDAFRRRYTVQEASPEGLKALSATVTTLARAESLEAHARAVTVRVDGLG